MTAKLTREQSRQRKLGSVLLVVGVAVASLHRMIGDYAYGMTSSQAMYIPDPIYVVPDDFKGETATHTFRIYNLRPRAVSLEAEADCGCTGLSWQKASIGPFAWKDISANVAVSPDQRLGVRQTVAVTLRSDSTEKPYLFAYIKK